MQNHRRNYPEISGGVFLDHDLNTLACLCTGSQVNRLLGGICISGSKASGKTLRHKAGSEVTVKVTEGMQ